MRAPSLVAVVMLVHGCAALKPSAAPAGDTESGSGPGAFRATSEAARRYNDPPTEPCPDKPLYRRIFRVVNEGARKNGQAVPRPDGRLCLVAEALVQLMIDGLPPPQPAVDFALSQVGIVEPAPNFLVLIGDAGHEDQLVSEFERRLERLPTSSRAPRAGVAAVRRPDGDLLIGLILQDSFVEVEPLLREVPVGVRPTVRGRLLSPYANPTVFVTRPGGDVVRISGGAPRGTAFSATIECDGAPGRYQVEVMGSASGGPTVLANFSMYCGVAAPEALALQSRRSAASDPEDAAREIFELLNEARQRAGLATLSWHDQAAAVARGHSTDMREHEFVAHVSPRTGDVTARVKKAGISTALTLENLARAYTPADVHQGLMNSPGHRANILHRSATHVGIGVVLDGAEGQAPALYVTQVFLRENAVIDLAAERDRLRRAIVARREDKGARGAKADAALDKLAQALAAELRDKNGEVSEARKQEILSGGPTRYRAIGALVTITSEIDGVSDGVVGKADGLGVGVAQGDHPTIGTNALYVVVLLGERG
jgi:uncharacterized protein YkwD